MNRNILIWLMLVVLGMGCTPKAALYRQNSEFRYDVDRAFYYDLRQENDSVHVYVKLTDPSLYRVQAGQPRQLSYLINLSYERDEVVQRGNLPGFDKRLQVFDDFAFFDFKISLAGLSLPAVLQLQVGAAGGAGWRCL